MIARRLRCGLPVAALASLVAQSLALAAPLQFVTIVQTDDAAPDVPGCTFRAFNAPILNNTGHMAFIGSLNWIAFELDTTNDEGIWVGYPEAFRLAAREADPVPGLPGVYYQSFTALRLDEDGRIAYISHIEGTGVTIDTDQALWAGQPGFESLLIRRGDWLNLGDGQNRKVFTFDIVDQKGELQVSGGQDGRSRSLNDRSEYAFHVTFVAGQGEAILFVPSVLDPDQNGVPAIAELAHGLTDLEPAANIHPSVGWQEGALVLQYRLNTLATNVRLEIEESTNLDGSWETSMAVSSLDSDQSGLPAGVERRRAVLAGPSAAARFYRIAVRPDLKPNPPAGSHAELF
ncbi:MAG TPA: hypothetical protein P5055_15605 [Candidatus Paceibacterota bacterium]|nr:hypothetical protein [Candidatus Paceibacterota bacterium]